MKKPESQDPANTRNAETQCALGLRRFSPHRNTPRKLDSRKNENTPSIASVCPMTPPAALEKRAQFVPNWNSMGIPVTTPTAKLMAKTRAQKRAALLYDSSFLKRARDLRTTMSNPKPIVSCGKR